MRGSVTRLSEKLGCGFIPGEDGRQAYFDVSALEGIDIRVLSIGKRVEYQEHFGHERFRQPESRSYRILRANPRTGADLFSRQPILFATTESKLLPPVPQGMVDQSWGKRRVYRMT